MKGDRMKAEYDFSKGKRGRVARVAAGKERITIRIDRDILAWFRKQVHASGGGNYQTLINQALRSVKEGDSPALESTLRRVIREEVSARRSSPTPRGGLRKRA
jgi:uncharacterized protein (DUF4415 family)